MVFWESEKKGQRKQKKKNHGSMYNDGEEGMGEDDVAFKDVMSMVLLGDSGSNSTGMD